MKLKLAELADLCLAQLYNLVQAEGQDDTQPISKIVHKFKANDPIAPEKVTYYLQSKQYVAINTNCFLALLTFASLHLALRQLRQVA